MAVGEITGVFGIRGELKCDPSNAGRTLFRTDEPLVAQLRDGASRNVTIVSVRPQQKRLLIAFAGVETAEEAGIFTGATLYAQRGRIPLEPHEYLDRDLTGCEVVDANQGRIGIVERVEHYPASDMLVVNSKLIPLIADFVRSIDIDAKRIRVDLPQGLLE